jgi:beta-xylosidase
MFVSAYQSDGAHRIGYVVAPQGAGPDKWIDYSMSRMQLSPGPQGDIDPHVFRDPKTSITYLVWKSDDNRIGLQTTRIWIQQLEIAEATGAVTQVGDPTVILDSTGMWWAAGFNGPASTLVEGPEMVYVAPFYYLFFAAGQYCGVYSEGAARSLSPTGPFEKMGSPVLSGGIVGTWNGAPLRGPGHATFISNEAGQLFSIFAAHTSDADCHRFPFIVEIVFENWWPVAKV